MTITRQSRNIGAVVGAAIGDAMGHPTEFVSSFEGLVERYGPKGVTRFEKYWEREGKRFAPYTDDTQMAEVVLRTLLEGHEELDETMTRMAQGFVDWAKNPQGGHRAPGMACMGGCRRLESGIHWSEAGGETAGGCGSVMRVYPFGLIFSDDIAKAEYWATEHSKLTHRDPIAMAACAAMTVAMVHIVDEKETSFILSEMVEACARYSGNTADLVEQAIREATLGIEPRVTLERLEGWAAHEAIAAAAYIFARHSDDFVGAVLEGANTPGDSDSLATLAGALTGARCGIEAIPEEWIKDVERSDELMGLGIRIGAEHQGV
ncbi:MAG: ADP-ribosylglycohydrolase family protein [Gemmataceae bacterium]